MAYKCPECGVYAVEDSHAGSLVFECQSCGAVWNGVEFYQAVDGDMTSSDEDIGPGPSWEFDWD
jgi:ribosomal protein L37AE/L43A